MKKVQDVWIGWQGMLKEFKGLGNGMEEEKAGEESSVSFED